MIAKLQNGTLVPLHWNDRYYEAACPECFEDVWTKTIGEMETALNEHCEVLPVIRGGYCPQCEWSQNNCHCVEYNLPLPE